MREFTCFLMLVAASAAFVNSPAASAAMEALPKKAPVPADNPMTPAKIELGKQLFFDPRLSKTGSVSCFSCHNVMGGGDDNLPTSFGVNAQRGGRSAPTVWNSAFMSVLFWDGRAPSLEEQSKGPLVNPVEMGMNNTAAKVEGHELILARIRQIPGYVEEFKAVYGGEGLMSIAHVAKAIASYERTLLTPDSPLDRYVRGNKKAMSEAAVRGMKKVEQTGCLSCHTGPNFAGPALPPGVGFYQKFPVFPGSEYDKKYNLTADAGRFEVTHSEVDRGVWRVATWRNVALTAPYFHNGSVKTLDEAVRVMAKVQLNRELPNADVQDIVAFLNALTGELPKQTMPRLPATPGRTVLE